MGSYAIESYLDRPPYYGRSHARDNAVVKPLCGPTAKFDRERKMWSTRCEDALRALVASNKWRPVGIEMEDYAALMRAAVERRAKAEARGAGCLREKVELDRHVPIVQPAPAVLAHVLRHAVQRVLGLGARRHRRPRDVDARARAA